MITIIFSLWVGYNAYSEPPLNSIDVAHKRKNNGFSSRNTGAHKLKTEMFKVYD